MTTKVAVECRVPPLGLVVLEIPTSWTVKEVVDASSKAAHLQTFLAEDVRKSVEGGNSFSFGEAEAVRRVCSLWRKKAEFASTEEA